MHLAMVQTSAVSTGISLSCNNLRNSATNAICEMRNDVYCVLLFHLRKRWNRTYPSLVCSGSVTSMQWSGRSSDCPGLRVCSRRDQSLIQTAWFLKIILKALFALFSKEMRALVGAPTSQEREFCCCSRPYFGLQAVCRKGGMRKK